MSECAYALCEVIVEVVRMETSNAIKAQKNALRRGIAPLVALAEDEMRRGKEGERERAYLYIREDGQ